MKDSLLFVLYCFYSGFFSQIFFLLCFFNIMKYLTGDWWIWWLHCPLNIMMAVMREERLAVEWERDACSESEMSIMPYIYIPFSVGFGQNITNLTYLRSTTSLLEKIGGNFLNNILKDSTCVLIHSVHV